MLFTCKPYLQNHTELSDRLQNLGARNVNKILNKQTNDLICTPFLIYLSENLLSEFIITAMKTESAKESVTLTDACHRAGCDNFKTQHSVGCSVSWNKNTNLIGCMQQLCLLNIQSEKLVFIQQTGFVPAVGVFNY